MGALLGLALPAGSLRIDTVDELSRVVEAACLTRSDLIVAIAINPVGDRVQRARRRVPGCAYQLTQDFGRRVI